MGAQVRGRGRMWPSTACHSARDRCLYLLLRDSHIFPLGEFLRVAFPYKYENQSHSMWHAVIAEGEPANPTVPSDPLGWASGGGSVGSSGSHRAGHTPGPTEHLWDWAGQLIWPGGRAHVPPGLALSSAWLVTGVAS